MNERVSNFFPDPETTDWSIGEIAVERRRRRRRALANVETGTVPHAEWTSIHPLRETEGTVPLLRSGSPLSPRRAPDPLALGRRTGSG